MSPHALVYYEDQSKVVPTYKAHCLICRRESNETQTKAAAGEEMKFLACTKEKPDGRI